MEGLRCSLGRKEGRGGGREEGKGCGVKEPWPRGEARSPRVRGPRCIALRHLIHTVSSGVDPTQAWFSPKLDTVWGETSQDSMLTQLAV